MLKEVGDFQNEGRSFSTIIEKVSKEMLALILPEGERVEDYVVKVQLLKNITDEEAFMKGYVDENGNLTE